MPPYLKRGANLYKYKNLLNLQHAVVLQCLKDISTPKKRKVYWYSAYRGLEIYAPCYGLTAKDIISEALKSGYIEKFTESEQTEYGEF